MWIYQEVAGFHVALQYIAWIVLPCLFLLISFCVVTYFAPQAIGKIMFRNKTARYHERLLGFLRLRDPRDENNTLGHPAEGVLDI